MALIKTVAEIKVVLPKFLSVAQGNVALPNFDKAEYKYLVPVVGPDLYNDIHTKYNANPQTLLDDDKVLLLKMQLYSTVNAFLDELALGQLVLTENGFKKLAANQTYRWEYEKLENTLKTIAVDALEVLLNYLFDKKPALWISSDAYKQYSNFLIKSGTEFSLYYGLFQPMRTYYALRSRILDAQDLYLAPEIGNDLLQHLIDNNVPYAASKYRRDPLKSALAFFTIKQSCMHDTARFTENGFTVSSGRQDQDHAVDVGRVNADTLSMQGKIDACNNDGNTYLSMAKDALVAYYKGTDATDLFKQAFDKGPLVNYVDPADRTSGNSIRKGVFRL